MNRGSAIANTDHATETNRRYAAMRTPNSFPNSARPWLLLALTGLSIALVIVGSIGPWLYTEFGPSRAREVIWVSGTSTDGVFSIFFAGIAALLLVWLVIRPAMWVLAWGIVVVMAFASLVGFFDWIVFEPMELTMRSAQRPMWFGSSGGCSW